MFKKWSSIEGLHNVVKFHNRKMIPPFEFIMYIPKIKLHGTNAAVNMMNNDIRAQKRTSFIDVANDNFEFAKFVQDKMDGFNHIHQLFGNMIIYGEWCGPGIQKGVALNKIPYKFFAVFAIRMQDDERLIVGPDEISSMLSIFMEDEQIKVLEWFNPGFMVNLMDRERLQKFADESSEIVEQIGKCDPFVKEHFGIEGPGEGLVYYPFVAKVPEHEIFSDYAFKVKSENHRVVKTKKAAQIDPEEIRTYSEFAEKFVTDARCEQAAQEATSGDYDMKEVTKFMAWIGQDIKKESEDEREMNNIDWKKAVKDINKKAVDWYKVKAFKL